jgi:hypothetical protein
MVGKDYTRPHKYNENCSRTLETPDPHSKRTIPIRNLGSKFAAQITTYSVKQINEIRTALRDKQQRNCQPPTPFAQGLKESRRRLLLRPSQPEPAKRRSRRAGRRYRA